jgi:hypothetical protein
VPKNLLSRAFPYHSHVYSLVPSAFVVVNSHQSALDPRRVVGYGSFSLCILKEDLYPSSEVINRRMMIEKYSLQFDVSLFFQMSLPNFLFVSYKLTDTKTCVTTNPAAAKFKGEETADPKQQLLFRLKNILQDVEVQTK